MKSSPSISIGIPVRLMTYNIHKGIGGIDRRYNLQRIVEVVKHYQPDILFLQEVDEDVPRSSNHRQVELLAKELEFEYIKYQKNVKVKRGHYGNAILSRFPLDDSHDLDLKVSIKKNRRALWTDAKIDLQNHEGVCNLSLCNTHLGLAGLERKIQIRKILDFERLAKMDSNSPVIIGGDFNDLWSEHGRKLMSPIGFQCAVKKAKTFPAAFPLLSLDAVYYRGDLHLTNSFAGRIKIARRASDHLPVIADFLVGQSP